MKSCRIVKEAGGVLHSFLVGQVLEHKDVDWLKAIIKEGHPIGNHTYDHVRVTAKNLTKIQYRCQSRPWLIAGKTTEEVISENIGIKELATCSSGWVLSRMGSEHPMLLPMVLLTELIYRKCYSPRDTPASSKYTGPTKVNRKNLTEADFDAFVTTHKLHQPFVYPTGLIEVPFSPPMDVGISQQELETRRIPETH